MILILILPGTRTDLDRCLKLELDWNLDNDLDRNLDHDLDHEFVV